MTDAEVIEEIQIKILALVDHEVHEGFSVAGVRSLIRTRSATRQA